MPSAPPQPAPPRHKNTIDSQHRVSKSTKKSKSGKGKGASGEVKLYVPAVYPVENTLWYLTVLDWDAGRLVAGTRSITFGADFEVRDTHLSAIINTGPALCNSLQYLCCSQATFLNDTSITKLAKACPNLVHVEVEKGIRLTDSTVLALVRNCRNLKFLSFAGGKELPGKISGSVLEKMVEDRDLGRSLEKLVLADQGLLSSAWEGLIRDLSKSRRKMVVEIIQSHKREIASSRTWIGGVEQMSGVQQV